MRTLFASTLLAATAAVAIEPTLEDSILALALPGRASLLVLEAGATAVSYRGDRGEGIRTGSRAALLWHPVENLALRATWDRLQAGVDGRLEAAAERMGMGLVGQVALGPVRPWVAVSLATEEWLRSGPGEVSAASPRRWLVPVELGVGLWWGGTGLVFWGGLEAWGTEGSNLDGVRRPGSYLDTRDEVRVVGLSVQAAVGHQPDRDLDGIPDVRDRCPLQAEDKDGFHDDDGCRDPDNDRDGLPDARDRCPDLPEDFDGFQDEDGCRDPDNDQDGVLDESDRCPDLMEDRDGFQDNDGCPEGDNDGDGIPDSLDRCPAETEDSDGFEDTDGCPDPDNDRDGIPDTADRCPQQTEDTDGFEDADGCPDSDDDGDGVSDPRDACPREAGLARGQACPRLPEHGVALPLMGFSWPAGSSALPVSARPAIDRLAGLLLRKGPGVRFAVHAEGTRELALRRSRSVVAALVVAGVPSSSLLASGPLPRGAPVTSVLLRHP